MVSGRLVNGYCTDDWLLRFLYGAATITNTISGLRPVTVEMEQRTKRDAEEREGQELQQKQSHTQAQLHDLKQQQKEAEDRERNGRMAEEEGVEGVQKGRREVTDEAPASAAAKPSDAPSSTAADLDAATGSNEGRGELKAEMTQDGDVDGLGVENVDLTATVDGHMGYPRHIADCLDRAHFRP